MKKNGFTLLEIMIVIVVIGILYTVISSNGLFAVEKASETATSVDMGIYEIALYDVFNEYTLENNNLDFFCNILNSNLDMQFQVQVVDNYLESIYRENKDGNKYVIRTSNFKDFNISCGEYSKEVNVG